MKQERVAATVTPVTAAVKTAVTTAALTLESKSIVELQALLDSTARTLKEKQAAVRDDTIAQIREIATAAGIKVFIRGENKIIKILKTYQHPENPAVLWVGKGAKPKWLKEYLNAGRTLTEFEVIQTEFKVTQNPDAA